MDCRQPWQPCRLLLFPITADTGKSLWIEACPCLVEWGAGCGLWLAVVEKPLPAQRLDERGRHGLVVLAHLLIAVDGVRVSDSESMDKFTSLKKKTVRLDIMRKQQPVTLVVTLH